MPREQKKRGKRGSTKRMRDDQDDVDDDQSKRRRTDDNTAHDTPDYIALDVDGNDDATLADEPELFDGVEERFYGMLDEQEQEYFRRADEMLEVNQFADADERSLFIQNVFKEAAGKELKLACSQSCSRLLERLLLLSTAEQLKLLFDKFRGEFIQLMSHRFASHCCETLLIQSATAVSDELANDPQPTEPMDSATQSSMENKFLDIASELGANFGFMITNVYASHALRILLIIFSGEPLDATQSKSLIASKQKHHVEVAASKKSTEQTLPQRVVPQSFHDTLKHIIQSGLHGLDSNSIRGLANHKTGNPILQLLLRLDVTLFGKQRGNDSNSILKQLLPDDNFGEDTESASFIKGTIYDPVGAHLVEAIILHAPGKIFKNLYKDFFRDRLASLARNDRASYVVCRILERLSAHDLDEAMAILIPEISTLAERGRTNIIKTLAERVVAREINAKPLADALKVSYSRQDSSTLSLQKLLQLPEDMSSSPDARQSASPSKINTSPAQNAASILAQALLKLSGPLSSLIFDAFGDADSAFVQTLALTPTLSPILQVAMTADSASIIFRRKLITHMYGSIVTLSTSSSGSHVVDAIEVGTRKDLAFVRERVAEEMAEREATMRDSPTGRKVWRNWDMDSYQRNREKWVSNTRRKVGNNGFQSLPGRLGQNDILEREKGKGTLGRLQAAVVEGANIAAATTHETHQQVHENFCEPIKQKSKTALDRARERYAQRQAKV